MGVRAPGSIAVPSSKVGARLASFGGQLNHKWVSNLSFVTIAQVVDLPGVREAVEDARASMDLLRKQRILRTKGIGVRALVLSESARALAQLGGIELPVAVALLQSSISTASAVATAPMQTLARFHAIALAAETDDDRGRPRNLTQEESARLFSINELLASESQVPALIVAALVMGEIMDLAPFERANQVVAQTFFRSILIGRGFDPDALGLPEVGMLALGATSFAPALAAYRSGSSQGVALWLRHLCSAVQLGVQRGFEICDEIGETSKR